MTFTKLIKKNLSDDGFDGYFHPDGICECDFNNLLHCGLDLQDDCPCKPGYKHTDKEGNWYIDGEKE